MTATESFYLYHHCDKPNVFGGIKCESCGFECMVVSWLGGVEEDNE